MKSVHRAVGPIPMWLIGAFLSNNLGKWFPTWGWHPLKMINRMGKKTNTNTGCSKKFRIFWASSSSSFCEILDFLTSLTFLHLHLFTCTMIMPNATYTWGTIQDTYTVSDLCRFWTLLKWLGWCFDVDIEPEYYSCTNQNVSVGLWSCLLWVRGYGSGDGSNSYQKT